MLRQAFAAVCLVVAVPAGAQYYPASGGVPYYPAPLAAPSYTVPDDGEPLPPAGAAPGFVPPARDGDGDYRTPNRRLSAGEAAWHPRVALNVAALGCRGAGDGDTPGAYAALLDVERAPLATAYAATRAVYRGRRPGDAEAAYDDDMTRLYNFFAQPPAHDAFCAAARTVLDAAAGVAPDQFERFAPPALAALEAPFLRHFAAYDAYREALAAWRRRHAPVVIATAAPVAVGPALTPP